MFKFIVGTVFVIVSLLAIYYLVKSNNSLTEYGTVIILNGPSASGKSSIQREFQKLMMPHLWVKVGIDNLFDFVMPNITPENMNFWQSANPIRWVETIENIEHQKVITLFMGQEGEQVAYAMNSAIAAYAKNGCNVIVDYIAYKPEWFTDLQDKLKDYKTYYVAVDIPLEALEQREAARGTSPQGHARSHYATVHGNQSYDLRVNSDQHSAEEIAKQLYALVTK